MLLLRVTEALRKARVAHAVVGGHAVALHGAIRGTLDIDLVIRLEEKAFVAAERALQSIGLQSRLPVGAAEVFRFREEYLANRNLAAWSFVNPDRPSEIVDIVLTHDLAHMRTRSVRIEDCTVRIAALDDLIEMKRAAGRPQDLEDARALETIKTNRESRT